MSDRDLKKMKCAVQYVFCHRLGISAWGTVVMLHGAYKEDCLDDLTIFRWYNVFKGVQESAGHFPPSIRPVIASSEGNTNNSFDAKRSFSWCHCEC